MTDQNETIQPLPEDIRDFIGVFERLELFEAQSRLIRGSGAFRNVDLPIPAVGRVLDWLKEKVRV